MTATALDWHYHDAQLTALEAELDHAYAASSLPDDRDREGVNHFRIDCRLGTHWQENGPVVSK